MIEYIHGQITDLIPTSAIIECSGIGYEVNINLIDYAGLQNKAEALLYVHEIIREDQHILYGFITRRARELFRLLIGVSGVGPGTARLIMSSLTPSDIENVIATGQESMLKAVKGIGARTAQRIIVDLKDKIKSGDTALFTQAPHVSQAFDESLQALLMLGFTKLQSEKALKHLFSAHPDLTVEEAVKQALKML